MGYQTIFERYELKYLLAPQQILAVRCAIKPYMKPDQYGRSSVRNIYLDTDTFRLVRRSIEKPAYKEKLRVRSYGGASENETVFVELKKKYQSVVYKRRLALPQSQAMAWLCGTGPSPQHSQIAAEIEYFLSYYATLRPAVFLSYEREAFCARDGSDLRITFDQDILAREDCLSLKEGTWGTALLPDGYTLMEVKTGGGMPLWLAHLLNSQALYKTSFSKYGAAYQTMIYPNRKGGLIYA